MGGIVDAIGEAISGGAKKVFKGGIKGFLSGGLKQFAFSKQFQAQ